MKRFSGYYLPEELQAEILLKLQVKSLLRFRSVCKSWQSLITSKKFVTDHLRTSTRESKAAFFNNKVSTMVLAVKDKFEKQLEIYLLTTMTLQPIYVPRVLEDGEEDTAELRFSSQCHGIVCLVIQLWKKERVFFYNPALREHRSFETPFPTLSPYLEYICFSYGFGHDPETDDYKFVRISKSSVRCKADVYSLRTGHRREIEIGYYVSTDRFGTYLEGRCYWVDYEKKSLLSFGMSDERFVSLELPSSIQWGIGWPVVLMLWGESLVCFVRYSEVWVMSLLGGGWAKEFEMNRRSARFGVPVAFWKEDVVLLAMTDIIRGECTSAVYNLRTKHFRKLPVRGAECLLVYVESLVSVKTTNNNGVLLGAGRRGLAE